MDQTYCKAENQMVHDASWPAECYLDELASVLDSRVLSGAIGIEGTPFAGKSTLAAKLSSEFGATLIPEHTDFDLGARDLALSSWPNDPAVATARQAHFYRVERQRMEAAVKALAHGSSVVLDRTALSVIVYSLTRAVTDGESRISGLRDLDILLEDTGVRFPAVLYLLQVPVTVVLERARHLVATGTPRAIEPFLLDPTTLSLLNFFYTKISSRLRNCKVIVEGHSSITPDIGE
jgi:thymidylate kinase